VSTLAKDFLNKLTDTAKSGLDKAKEVSGQVSVKASVKAKDFQPVLDQAKSKTHQIKERISESPTYEKFQEHVSPHAEKFKDNIDAMSGKQLEEKLTEYTDVFSDVLLNLYRRVEEDRVEHKHELQQIRNELESLKTTVQRMQQELARTIKT
jgi:gas vesicle protein